jgi:ligand-binding sensor domain-containing protein
VSVFDGKTFTNYSTKDGLFNETNRTIVKDKNGNIWFGSYDMGLSKFDGKVFTSFTEK